MQNVPLANILRHLAEHPSREHGAIRQKIADAVAEARRVMVHALDSQLPAVPDRPLPPPAATNLIVDLGGHFARTSRCERMAWLWRHDAGGCCVSAHERNELAFLCRAGGPFDRYLAEPVGETRLVADDYWSRVVDYAGYTAMPMLVSGGPSHAAIGLGFASRVIGAVQAFEAASAPPLSDHEACARSNYQGLRGFGAGAAPDTRVLTAYDGLMPIVHGFSMTLMVGRYSAEALLADPWSPRITEIDAALDELFAVFPRTAGPCTLLPMLAARVYSGRLNPDAGADHLELIERRFPLAYANPLTNAVRQVCDAIHGSGLIA